ncbi:uncharacterized protein LOC135492707 isoform X2 [Lineus longissimus]|uniref:uncharacterized protein LOC135492707 isoform X2 n=1 Tax=Lineus longissimus TaxID=88925 RepID=UPI002B4CAC03
MACVDFAPSCIKEGGWMSDPQYEPFSSLADRANGWLRSNPHYRVVAIETLDVFPKYGRALAKAQSQFTVMTSYYVTRSNNSSKTHRSSKILGLRIWYAQAGAEQIAPQQFGFINLPPALLDHHDRPDFETFGQTINKFNEGRSYRPLSGAILNMETVTIRTDSKGRADPDGTYFSGSVSYDLTFIRIFFIIGDKPVAEEIGCADFVPNYLGGEDHAFEGLTSVFNKASDWVTQQAGIRVTNIESPWCKVKSEHEIDSQRVLNHFWSGTPILRFVRVWYVKPLDASLQLPPPPMLRCQMFVPARMKTAGSLEKQFESVFDLTARVCQWLPRAGGRLMSVETITVPVSQYLDKVDPDRTRSRHKHHQKTFLRFYFDGEFQPPNPSTFPAPGEVVDNSSCEIM